MAAEKVIKTLKDIQRAAFDFAKLMAIVTVFYALMLFTGSDLVYDVYVSTHGADSEIVHILDFVRETLDAIETAGSGDPNPQP